MQKLITRNASYKLLRIIPVIIALALICMSGTAYADEAEALEVMSAFKNQIVTTLAKLTSIAEYMAGASFAYGVVKWLTGTEKEQERAMNHMKYSLLALFALFLLPLAVSAAIGVFKAYQWTP